jgi:hypothetical protein
VSIDDGRTTKVKRALLDGYEEQADKVEKQVRRRIITDGERRQQEVRIWTDATAEVQAAMEPGVLNFHTPIHDNIHAKLGATGCYLVIPDAQLQPQGFRANLVRFFQNLGGFFAFSKDINNVGGLRQCRKVRIHRVAKELFNHRVYEIHPVVTATHEIACDEITGP